MKRVLLFTMLAMALFTSSVASAQNWNVSGTVISADDNYPLVGATVLVEGTQIVAVTDIDGKYKISLPESSSKKLLVSFVGLLPEEKSVFEDGEIIDFALRIDAQAIEGIVVTGYGNVKTASYAGSAAVVNNEKMKDVPSISMTDRLAGNVAGLTVTSSSGQPGAVESVRIRGMGSINAGNSPLYVIDGVPMTSGNGAGFEYADSGTSILSTINPNDIETFTVIKDAAAASLYGSRAANGVIVITTKKGKAGKTKFNVKYDAGTSDMAIDWRPTLGGADRRDILSLGFYNYALYDGGMDAAAAEQFAADNIDGFAAEPWSGYTDWRDLLFRNGFNQNVEASVSGGNNRTRFYASVAYTDQEGITYNQNYDRISGRVNVDHNYGIFSLAASTMFSSINQEVSPEGLAFSSPFMALGMTVSPSDYPYNEDGSYNTTVGFPALGGGLSNPLYERSLNWDKNQMTRSMNNISAGLDLFEGFQLKQTVAYDYLQTNGKVWWDPRSNNGMASNGVFQRNQINATRLNSQTMATYNRIFDEKHAVSALLSFEAENNGQSSTYSNGSNYPTYLKPEIANAASTDAYSDVSSSTLISYVAKADYTYDNKFYVGGSFRRDGSSRLAPSKRWGNFWSLSAYYRLSQDEWWQNSIGSVITDAKVRASYGENGTQPSDWYGWQGVYGFGYNYNGLPGSAEVQFNNDALTWERNLATNIGIDLAFFDRIRIGFDWYNRDTKDLIMARPISSTSGFSSMLTNVGALKNQGWELVFNALAVDTPDVQWSLGFNLAHNSNKLVSLNDGQDEIVGAFHINRVGESYYSYYMYEYAGVDPETGKESFYKNTKNDDGSIDRSLTTDYAEAEKVIVGQAEPTITGGISSNFNYKWLDLGFTFTFSLGGEAYDAAYWIQSGGGTYNYVGNVPSYFDIDKTWKKPGDIAELPVFKYGSTSARSSRWLMNTDHLRLKNLTLGFSAPKNWLSAIHLSKARLYVSGSNLLTFKDKNCYVDPEVPIGGICYFESPTLRTVTVGLEIGF